MGGDLKEGIKTLPTSKTYMYIIIIISIIIFLWSYWIYGTQILYYFSNNVYDNFKVMIWIKNKVSELVMSTQISKPLQVSMTRAICSVCEAIAFYDYNVSTALVPFCFDLWLEESCWWKMVRLFALLVRLLHSMNLMSALVLF